jgi:hypothetical protein
MVIIAEGGRVIGRFETRQKQTGTFHFVILVH